MIRPFTCLCFLLACASGLYLYQSKHRVQMLDRDIERTVHMTEATRDQARLLNAEWMLLNDPERLRTLADQFLALKTVTPGQFTTMADLDRRLPPVRSPDAPLEPVPEPAVMTPMVPPAVAQVPPTGQPVAPADASAPRPAPAPLVAERKPATERPAATRLAQTDAPRPEPRPASVPHVAVLAQAAPRPRFSAPVVPIQGSVMPMGSALGMASQAGSLPPPKPLGFAQPIDH